MYEILALHVSTVTVNIIRVQLYREVNCFVQPSSLRCFRMHMGHALWQGSLTGVFCSLYQSLYSIGNFVAISNLENSSKKFSLPIISTMSDVDFVCLKTITRCNPQQIKPMQDRRVHALLGPHIHQFSYFGWLRQVTLSNECEIPAFGDAVAAIAIALKAEIRSNRGCSRWAVLIVKACCHILAQQVFRLLF